MKIQTQDRGSYCLVLMSVTLPSGVVFEYSAPVLGGALMTHDQCVKEASHQLLLALAEFVETSGVEDETPA